MWAHEEACCWRKIRLTIWCPLQRDRVCTVKHERTPEKGMAKRDEEHRREIQVGRCRREGKERERESGKECGSGVRQNLNPFNGDKSPSARALLRRAGRQFVRVYPTYPDISTWWPGVARVANHPATSLTSLTHPLFLYFLTCISSFLSLTFPPFLPSIFFPFHFLLSRSLPCPFPRVIFPFFSSVSTLLLFFFSFSLCPLL